MMNGADDGFNALVNDFNVTDGANPKRVESEKQTHEY